MLSLPWCWRCCCWSTARKLGSCFTLLLIQFNLRYFKYFNWLQSNCMYEKRISRGNHSESLHRSGDVCMNVIWGLCSIVLQILIALNEDSFIPRFWKCINDILLLLQEKRKKKEKDPSYELVFWSSNVCFFHSNPGLFFIYWFFVTSHFIETLTYSVDVLFVT